MAAILPSSPSAPTPTQAQASHRPPATTSTPDRDRHEKEERRWVPKRTLAECERIMTAPGALHEMELALVDGRVLRVYKHLPSNVRAFWLALSSKFAERAYVVHEGERLSYADVRERSLRLAAFLHTRCGVRQGDRVAILSRNTPAYLVLLWASQLLGAVTVFLNAWSPPAVLRHCVALTRPAVLFVDPERAAVVCKGGTGGVAKGGGSGGESVLQAMGSGRVFVVGDLSPHSSQSQKWGEREGVESLEEALEGYDAPALVFDDDEGSTSGSDSDSGSGSSQALSNSNPHPPNQTHTHTHIHPPKSLRIPGKPLPDAPATLFFTSGTTGLPKGVLSSQRAFLANIANALAGKFRAVLREGGDLPDFKGDGGKGGVGERGGDGKGEEEQRCFLLSVPMFHVTGLTSTVLVATALGAKLVLMRKWDKDAAARLILRERVTSAGGVPSMAMDLLESALLASAPSTSSSQSSSTSSASQSQSQNTDAMGPGILEALAFGGAPSAKTLPEDIRRRFGGRVASGQGYGLSETNAVAVSVQGEDYLARPESTGLAAPINDLLIVDPHTLRVMPPGEIGEIWIKGSNVMTEYYRDPAATEKAITKDGWFRSGDLATMDEEGFVYIKDRYKDMIIRGGENIHSTEVENALYADERLLDAAAVSVPDRRLGELVAAVVATRPHFRGCVTEESVVRHARALLPAHAVPVLVLVLEDMIERNANGKIVKTELRKLVRKEWARRLAAKKAREGPADAKAKL